MQEQAIKPNIAEAGEDPQPLHEDRYLHWLVPAVTIGVVLSLPAVVSVPIQPMLAPIVVAWLILTILGMLFLPFPVYKALLIPDGQSAPRWWQTRKGQTTRPYLYLAINASSFLYAFGASLIASQWWTLSRYWDSLQIGFSYLVAGTILYCVFVIMWGRAGSTVDRILSRGIGSVLVVVLGGIAWLGVFLLLPAQLSRLKTGPAATWTEQWSVVQQAINNRYPDAVLHGILVSHEYDAPPTCDASLKLFFSFIRSDGSSVSVGLRDTNPEASVHVNDLVIPQAGTKRYTAEDLGRLKELEGTIQISPRDALLSAESAYEKDVPGANGCAMPGIWLYLADPTRGAQKTFDKLNRLSVWAVSLYSDVSSADQERYWIDAQTEDILLHDQD